MAAGKAQPLRPEDWVDQHGDALFRYALVRARDASVAEELVQETLLAALEARDKFSGLSSERTWLFGILKHKILDYYRRLHRQSQLSEAETAFVEPAATFMQTGEWVDHFDAEQGPRDWRQTPEAAVEQAEFWRVMSRCLDELPPRLASAFSLREMEQLSSEEVCKVLDISATNLWVMLHRARAHLRNCLQHKWFNAPV